jgi:hypothetical protein
MPPDIPEDPSDPDPTLEQPERTEEEIADDETPPNRAD